jgi:putative effector of murein hydrolase
MSLPAFLLDVAAVRATILLLGTLGAYEVGLRLQRRFHRHPVVNPVLIAVVLVAAALSCFGIQASNYTTAVQPLIVLLGPATVALALPLYRCLPGIRIAFIPVFASVLIGSLTAAVTAVSIALILSAPSFVVRAIATKSVTAAIAMAVAPQIGAEASLAAGLSVLTGIVGAVICTGVLNWAGVGDSRARGLATGITAHGIGTAFMLTVDAEAGAFSGLAMGLTGLVTGVVLPLVYGWFIGTTG